MPGTAVQAEDGPDSLGDQQQAEVPLQPPLEQHAAIKWCLKHRWRLCAAGAGLLLCAVSGAVWKTRRRARCRGARSLEQPSDGDGEGSPRVHIPLKEVVRFKERQWFMEELEASRGGDANSMLRLAKMYLHGQGCAPNLAMAQEWLRKARQQGMYATLDELWAGDAAELERQKVLTARLVAQRRAGMAGAAAAAAPSRAA